MTIRHWSFWCLQDGWTGFFGACNYSRSNVVRVLLTDNRVDINMQNNVRDVPV